MYQTFASVYQRGETIITREIKSFYDSTSELDNFYFTFKRVRYQSIQILKTECKKVDDFQSTATRIAFKTTKALPFVYIMLKHGLN